MLVCDFCARHSLKNMTKCRCNHTFCDSCADVSWCDEEEPTFSPCDLCPKCFVDCVNSKTKAALAAIALAKSKEEALKMPPPPAKPEPPSEFLCPITYDLMMDPVVLSDGFTYERASADKWLSLHLTSPMTGVSVLGTVTPNRVLRVMINEWKEKHMVGADA